MLAEFIAKKADESQVLSAYDRNILENVPKETIETHLKSIEKDIDYLEKGIDFYKKNPEQDYNGEMIKFNEKLLTPKLQMQKAYKQRLDELNSLDLSYAPKRNADEITTKIQEKFKFDEKKAKDLFEWHKDSSPLTKNDDGAPKVFYHGSPNEFEVFDILTNFIIGNSFPSSPINFCSSIETLYISLSTTT